MGKVNISLKSKNEDPKYLRHYTQLSSLMNIINTGKIILNNPTFWEDRNDLASIELFRRIKKADVVSVFCFAGDLEMVHHWYTYATGEKGCCIHFKTDKLVSEIKKVKSILFNKVLYISADKLKVSELKKMTSDEIPFIKRRPYECENEYRIVWAGKKTEKQPYINITGCIDYITLSPKFNIVYKNKLIEILDKLNIKIKESRILIENKWISKFNNFDKC